MATCAICGAENPDGFRFCGSCGADLAAAGAREVRKTVTVVFTDLTGSTALGEQLDPESLRRVMSRYFDEMKAVLERHGGTVEKFIGDAVMAVFGIPTLHEDDALRALRAAAEMRARLVAVNEELESELGVRLEARIGVNTGEVVTGDADARERLATGDAVNVAARLEQAAQPGEILLGEETRRLTRDAIEVEPAGELELKGKAAPLPAFRLARVVEGAAPYARRLDAPIVGRDEELASARAVFDAAVGERRCRLLTVLGPPGIGKSRLARELAANVNGAATVLTGQCLPYGEGITYWPVREIFVAAGAVAELDAALASGSPEDAFWSIRKALEQRARERPLLLVVDDIHWAEETLLDLLEHLVDWTRDAPVLLLCLSRPDLLDKRPAWASGRPNAEVVMLEPLAEADAEALIESLGGDATLTAEARARIRTVAEGNPLFVEQLLANVSDGDEPVPATIQALLAARLDGLPEGERDLLERAAVVGVDFEWEALGELLDGGRPSGATLAALVRKELIRPHDTQADAFRFRHVLIREAAYERVPKGLRAELHERVAQRMETRGEGLEAISGYHLEQAVRFRSELGLRDDRTQALAERAGSMLAEAGRRAHSRADLPAAGNLLERARALLPSGADRGRVTLRLADAVAKRGGVAESEQLVRQAAEEARASGDPVLELRTSFELAWLEHRDGGDLLRQAEEALAAFTEAGDEEGQLHALMSVAYANMQSGCVGAGADASERGLELARRLGEWQYQADMIAGFCSALVWGPAPVREAIVRIERQLATRRENPIGEAPGHVFLGILCALGGRMDDARRLFDHGQQVASSTGGLAWPMAWSRGGLKARIELLSGDYEAAEDDVRAAIAIHTEMGEMRTIPDFTLRLAEALWGQGREEEGVAAALGVEESPDPDPQLQAYWRYVRAQALARSGELQPAELLAREAVGLLDATDLLWDQAEARMALADVLGRAGRPEEEKAVTRQALALYEQKGHVVGAECARAALAD